jgi:hypothetical protein
MATVATSTTPRKAPKAFRATLRDESGALTTMDGAILFFSDAGEIITIEPEDSVWLCVLGEIGLSECQALADKRHGGFARIATSRLMEVQ